MTEQELSQKLGITIEVFEDHLFPDEAFYIPSLKTIADEVMVKEEYIALIG